MVHHNDCSTNEKTNGQTSRLATSELPKPVQLGLDQRLSHFYSKDEVVICVMDLGLGGLSTLSLMETRFQNTPLFRKVSLVYYNCRASTSVTQRKQRDQIAYFDAVLKNVRQYECDLILLACNTLSVLYNQTIHSTHCCIPVISIFDLGVDMLADRMLADGRSVAMSFGTTTTIHEAAHATALANRGVDSERVITQSCPTLASTIESHGPGSTEVKHLISRFVNEAWDRTLAAGLTSSMTGVIVCLFCTHYGYSLPLWKDVSSGILKGKSHVNAPPPSIIVVNPNARLADYVFDKNTRNLCEKTNVSIRVMSTSMLTIDQINSIAPCLSPTCAHALQNYEHVCQTILYSMKLRQHVRRI